jgi:sarcosine oxidase subunit gamma
VSALDAVAIAAGDDDFGPMLGERGLQGYLNLRGKLAARRFTSAVESAIGGKLPRRANTANTCRRCQALWLSPDEWLLVTTPGGERALLADLIASLDGIRHALNDQTSGYTTIRLRGPHVRQVLAKGCTIDLDASVFEAPQIAQTLLAKAGVILQPLPHGVGFDITVRRSFADYLWQWLSDALAEYD